jgi:type II secretory pathway pseudopilin PulG
MKVKFYNQAGQTLIETLVASMVLVMGISAAVGLSAYALGASSNVNKQLIANGLAREGIEAVKNMRDTNWLGASAYTDCFEFYTQSNTGVCHKDWLTNTYTLNSSNPGTYTLGLDTDSNGTDYWKLIPTSSAFGLNYNNSDPALGIYSPGESGVTVTNSNSKFGRKITISMDTFQPFDRSDLGSRVKVRVDVWWNDKRCPVSDDVPTNSSCKLSLETYLTNWKNY